MKLVLIFTLSMVCLSLNYAQTPIILGDKIEILSFDEKTKTEKKVLANLTLPQLTDWYCENLRKIEKKANANVLTVMGTVLEVLVEDKQLFDSLALKRVSSIVSLDSARLEIVKEVIVETFQSCNSINDALKYDGQQRPAYAHINQLLCNCIDNKKQQLSDNSNFLKNYQHIKDSCYTSIITNEDVKKIVFAANSFQSNDQINDFNKNFGVFFAKNCTEEQKIASSILADYWKYIVQKNEHEKGLELLSIRQNAMRAVINKLNESQFSGDYHTIFPFFQWKEMSISAKTDLNQAHEVLKNQKNIDWIQEDNRTLNKVTSYKLTVYKYNVQTKKRNFLCQLHFDFFDEKALDLITEFHFIPKTQIKDLQDIENRINKKY